MKKINFRVIAASAFFAAFLACVARAQTVAGKSGIEAKVALESSLESRLKRVLTEIAGTEDIIVIVNAELAKEQTKTESAKKTDDFILPGVPIREAISEKSVQSAVMSALGEDTRTLIRRLTATIIIDKKTSADTEKIIREVASGLLGVDESRGDKLVIQKMAFRKQTFTFASLFYPPNIFFLIAVTSFAAAAAAITAFLMGAGRDFTKNLVGAVEKQAAAIKESSASGREAGAADEASPSSAAAAAALTAGASAPDKPSMSASASGASRPFAFIGDNNLAALNYILRSAPPAVTATVLGCLEPPLAAKVLERLPASVRAETGRLLAETRQLPPDETERLQTEIKRKIDYIAGGESHLAAIVENLDDSLREETLSGVDAERSAKIRKEVVTVGLLEKADPSAIGLIVKHLGAASFAQILKSFPEEIRRRLLSAIPAGAASRINQEMELAKSFAPARLAVEKKRLVALMKRMRAAGLIEI